MMFEFAFLGFGKDCFEHNYTSFHDVVHRNEGSTSFRIQLKLE